jgi:ribosome-associated protein
MTQLPAANADSPSRVRIAVAAMQDRQAVDLRVLDLDEISEFTEYFLVCSGSSERQVRAIADGVDEKLRAEGSRPLHVEGYEHGQWILLDYGDFLVHIFVGPVRDYYRLEQLWADAPDVTPDFL